MPSPVQMKTLLEAGVHFGHQTRRWNPKMKTFIFTERNGIHIIDLQQTVRRLEEAMGYVRELSANGGTLLFVGTKKQAQETIEEEANRCGMPHVNRRWMGGTLTNFHTIKTRIQRLEELEQLKEMGEFERLPKKEAGRLEDQLSRLTRLLGGLRGQYKLPDAVFIVDPHREEIAVAESRRAEIPIIAMVDTNCNPELIDQPIPANDDAIRAIRLLTSKIADSVIEGRQDRESAIGEGEAVIADAEVAEGEDFDKVAALDVHLTAEDFLRGDSEGKAVAGSLVQEAAAEKVASPEPPPATKPARARRTKAPPQADEVAAEAEVAAAGAASVREVPEAAEGVQPAAETPILATTEPAPAPTSAEPSDGAVKSPRRASAAADERKASRPKRATKAKAAEQESPAAEDSHDGATVESAQEPAPRRTRSARAKSGTAVVEKSSPRKAAAKASSSTSAARKKEKVTPKA